MTGDELRKTKRLILALDFGGTKLAAAVAVPGERGFLAKATAPSPTKKSAEADRKIILKLAARVLAGRKPAAVGVSFGGPVQAEEGRVVLSHHVPGWEGFPLAGWLEERFGAPAVVENDANSGALGEWAFGAGRGTKSFLYVTVSTGIGGGWILNGEIYHGADGLAGEIGHLLIDLEGPVCTCGRRGCLEAIASGPAIARRARELLASERSVLQDLPEITAREVARAANAGDPVAERVLRGAAQALGRALAQAITLVNPGRIAIGGGVARSGERFFTWTREAARRYVPPQARVEIVPAQLLDDAPLWGAVALAERLFEGTQK
ncbi:MAG: Glucokinase [Acetothermia bacterium 64_32]|nr:MAG: Glucokinase [Acetothermia bacterium 64_32]HAF70918.1 sugar kinase [Candidatus Acetothermia bacterium]